MTVVRRYVAVAAALLVAAVFAFPTPAGASQSTALTPEAFEILTLGSDFDGVRLTGNCLAPPAPLEYDKEIFAAQTIDWLWAPVRLATNENISFNQVLVPYEVTLVGPGLKTRHVMPGETVTRPGPTPKSVIACHFSGTIIDTDGNPVTADVFIKGTLRHFPGNVFPFPKL